MQNNKYWFFGSKLNTALLLVLIILMIVALRFMFQNNETYLPKFSQEGNNEINIRQIEGNKEDLVFLSVLPNTKVSGILKLKGEVKGGYFSEANILVNILNGNKVLLKAGNGNATTDWMTVDPVSFDSNLDFTGLPKGDAYIEIKEDDPSSGEGGPIKSIFIPIVIQ